METLIGVLVWIVVALAFCYFCARIAIGKGRSPILWAILGAVFPLISLIVVALLPAAGPKPVE